MRKSFGNMIKNKRVQVLAFVIFLFALRAVTSADNLDVPNLVQLVKKTGNTDEGFCVAFDEEAYSAIEWSYPIPKDETELPKIVSSYLPSPTSSYGCNFEDDHDCDKAWNLKNWIKPTHTSKNYKPILDSRWEDIRTYLVTNKVKIGEYRVEIPTNSEIGISIRSANSVDILLCEGFNPESYPCYKIILGSHTKKNIYIENSGTKYDVYKSEFPLISIDEWKHFNLFLSSDGRIQLGEINKDGLHLPELPVVKHSILYLLVNSSEPALWKIHKNHFLSTNSSQYTEFGPPMNVTSSTLCLSMYLMMCKNCSIYFYKTVGIDKEIVFELNSEHKEKISYEWTHIKIVIENLTESTVPLFIKTNSDAIDRFWAIDNVRTCIQTEFKIRSLVKSEFSKNIEIKNPSFSCHSLEFPKWRPKPELMSTAGLPIVTNSPSTTSIQLHWIPSSQPFIINYKGSDICSRDTTSPFKNIQRLRSNGWIVVKPKEKGVLIQNLIPYTHYDVTFVDPVFGVNKSLSMNTIHIDKPTAREILTIYIRPKVREAAISISLPKCNISFGPIAYRLDMVQQSKPQTLVDNNVYTWKNLEPHTNYTLSVQTARTITALDNPALRTITYYNFTTRPDVAPPLEDVELYEISETSASFRYKLPRKSNGVPIFVQISGSSQLLRRNKQNISDITHCDLWKEFYCAVIINLTKNVEYKFTISIKNNNTNTFGKEVEILKKTSQIAPGAPTNLSYSVINCSAETDFCNLNISWVHPFDQRGIIRGFGILLQEEEIFSDRVLIEGGKYFPAYWHVVTELPYSKTYNLSIYAFNYYKSTYVTTEVKIDHLGQHIDQKPKILGTDRDSVTFRVPKLDFRLKSSIVLVVVQSNNSEEASILPDVTPTFQEMLCRPNIKSWLAGAWKLSHENVTDITIGDKVTTFVDALNSTAVNKALIPNVSYCFNFIFNNTFREVYHIMTYHSNNFALSNITDKYDEGEQTNTISVGSIIGYSLLVILFLAVIFGVVYYRVSKRKRRVRRDGREHIYEAMPDDEPNLTYNVVYNAVYDKLNHE